ncbi:hypothetical protein S83_046904, partial [Arachis hypogaea]
AHYLKLKSPIQKIYLKLRYFRKDGHNWRKKKHGKTVKEAHEKLKFVYNQVFISSNNYMMQGLWHFSIKFWREVLTCCIATMPMVKKMKNFRDEAIGCLNRSENLITFIEASEDTMGKAISFWFLGAISAQCTFFYVPLCTVEWL